MCLAFKVSHGVSLYLLTKSLKTSEQQTLAKQLTTYYCLTFKNFLDPS